MSASLSGVFNLQNCTDLGALMAGGRLYTYAPSTTTLKTAYTDAAGLVPHTYTSDGIGGQYIALNSRGELPAPLFLASGGYDITLKTVAGVTVWTRRAVGSDDAGATAISLLRADLADTASATKGAGMSGHAATLTYTAGSVGAHLRGTVSPCDAPWLADSTGADDSATAILACIAYAKANNFAVEFQPGTYKTSQPIVIDYSHADIRFKGRVTIAFTGAAAAAVSIDGGASGYIYDVKFGVGNMPVIQASGTTYGVYVRSCHQSDLRAEVTACTGAAWRIDFAVCTDFYPVASVNRQPWVTQPVGGLQVNKRTVGATDEYTTDCNFFAIIEGVSGDGIVCNGAQHCRFIGGTSEGNGGQGFVDGTECRNNLIDNLFCESNAGRDFYLGGYGSIIKGGTAGSGAVNCQIAGSRNVLDGGLYKRLQIDVGGYQNVLREVGFLDTASGGVFADSSLTTIYENTRMETSQGQCSVPNKMRRPKLKRVGGMAVTGATKATKCVVTIPAHGLDYGESITFAAVGGMVQLNGNTYTVEPIADTDQVYLLTAGAYVDSSAFGAYTAGGTATFCAFQNSWANAGGGYAEAGFYKTEDGIVHLTGAISAGTYPGIASTLPTGFRPAGQMAWTTVNASVPTVMFIRVNSAGSVDVFSGTGAPTNAFVSLDGINFKVA